MPPGGRFADNLRFLFSVGRRGALLTQYPTQTMLADNTSATYDLMPLKP
jgi:hypothetical protein